MQRLLGLAISAIAVAGGVLGLLRPETYRSVMEDAYTARSARVGGAVLLAMGLAGLYAVLVYNGEPIDFFPA